MSNPYRHPIMTPPPGFLIGTPFSGAKARHLVDDIHSEVARAMTATGISARELAKRMGVSEARVSQMFQEGANPTLRTVERMFKALNYRLIVQSEYADARRVENPEPPTTKDNGNG